MWSAMALSPTHRPLWRDISQPRTENPRRPARLRAPGPAPSCPAGQTRSGSRGWKTCAAGSSPTTSSTPPVAEVPQALAWRMASQERSRPGALPYHRPKTPSTLAPVVQANLLAAPHRGRGQIFIDAGLESESRQPRALHLVPRVLCLARPGASRDSRTRKPPVAEASVQVQLGPRVQRPDQRLYAAHQRPHHGRRLYFSCSEKSDRWALDSHAPSCRISMHSC